MNDPSILQRNCHKLQHDLRKQTPACYHGFQLPHLHLSHSRQLPRLHPPTSFPVRLPPLSCHTRDDVPYRAERPRCLPGCLHWDHAAKTTQQHNTPAAR